MSTPDERKLLSEDISKAREWIGKYFLNIGVYMYGIIFMDGEFHIPTLSSPSVAR